MNSVRWGILSTAKIGIQKVIPAIQEAENCKVTAISSRTAEHAEEAANDLGIPKHYDSYRKLLEDPEIDAIYNPLPNHLHVPKTKQALQNSKHVLCEKPIALNAEEAKELLQYTQRFPDLKVMEAFMYRFHPQWKQAKAMVSQGKIGQLQTIESFFSYFNDDPTNIRNKPEMGGGGLMDIGCYCISLLRFLFDNEPTEISGHWKIDPQTDTDYLASGVLTFNSGTATFSCSTQSEAHQRVNIVGTKGRIVIPSPFNPNPDESTTLSVYQNSRVENHSIRPINQYQLQAERFADAILHDTEVPTPLEDAINNMIAIDRFRESAINS